MAVGISGFVLLCNVPDSEDIGLIFHPAKFVCQYSAPFAGHRFGNTFEQAGCNPAYPDHCFGRNTFAVSQYNGPVPVIRYPRISKSLTPIRLRKPPAFSDASGDMLPNTFEVPSTR